MLLTIPFSKLSTLLAFIFITLYILNPYSTFGPLGLYISAPFFLLGISTSAAKRFISSNSLSILMLLLISIWGSFVSHYYEIPQLIHLYVTISMLVSIVACYGFIYFAMLNRINLSTIQLLALNAITLNSIVIIFEFLFPPFRELVESFLVQLNNDYLFSTRFRGIASAGGAALSLVPPIGMLLSFELLRKQRLSILMVSIYILVLFLSLLLIGRTGIVLSAIPIGLFIFTRYRKLYLSNLLSDLILSSLVFIGCFFFLDLIGGFFGDSFIYYTIGFLFQHGGIANEGTTTALVNQHLAAIPTEYPAAIFGYGFYGYGGFEPHSDSGFARMFMSVGIPLGLLYYTIFFRIIFGYFKVGKSVFLIFLFTLLLLAEIKETLMFSQFASRAFLLFTVSSFVFSNNGNDA